MLLGKVTETARSIEVMWKAGLIPFPRIDEGIRALFAARRVGPFAAAADSVARYLAWVEGDAPAGIPVLDELIGTTDDRPLPTPPSRGGFVLLTSGTTGTPKGAPREHTSLLSSAQFLDRIPLRAGEATYL